MRPHIGITLGDPAGIGPEVVDGALKSGRLPESAHYRIIGGYPPCTPGKPTPETARAAAAALDEAVDLATRGVIDAVVTGPIHKARMYDIGFRFPGQTEFFAERTGTANYAMLLTGGGLTVALVTTHIALRQIVELLSKDEIVRVGQLLAQFLQRRGSTHPRIAVAALNPHAGESGALGTEEVYTIRPAVEELQRTCGADVTFDGPFSPDTIFNRAVSGEWDAVLCMYHDQGLIPLKLHAFDEGVNVTIGLPFPRTSPDHGTAFEIAGKRVARPDSMIAAMRLAAELVVR
ncbi:MAG TPA: 4-hydroxythreonine-4-phosphate dehydrogenase PdxA [Chthoniobacterales bacterium]|nr:4-hydroxythreonine-4-phosphate dehydrogenase PdxA [Chthoniobacterales bacterium]